MESQPQNPEFRNNPESFYPCDNLHIHPEVSEVNSSTLNCFLWFVVLCPSQQLVIVTLLWTYRPQNFSESAYQKINFLISQSKHMLWVLKRTISMRRFF